MIQKVAIALLVGMLLYFPLFLHLDYMPIRNYDEARLSVNAVEFNDSPHFLVTTFKGKPDTWNTKPPLMIWLQSLSMRIFGVNELGIRFPSAIAAFLTCLMMIWFGRSILRKELAGILAALILVTCGGYTTIHVTRTGDYDSLVILFLTAQVLFGFAWIQEPHRKKYLWLAAAALTLGVLSKSIIGLMFLPALGLYILLRRDGRQLLTDRSLYLAFGAALAMIAGYYLWREQLQPGYLQAVWDNELGGRYLDTLESHDYSFWYYLKNMVNGHFWPWLLILPFSLLWNAIQPQARFSWLASWVAFLFLLLISLSQTKIYWYDAPIYPLLSFVIALALADLIHLVNRQIRWPTITTILVAACFIGLPYRETINRVHFPDFKDYNGAEDNVYRDAIRALDRDQLIVAKRTSEYSAHLLFYRVSLAETGQELDLRNISDLQIGEEALVCSHGRKKVSEQWTVEIVEEMEDCNLVRIISPAN